MFTSWMNSLKSKIWWDTTDLFYIAQRGKNVIINRDKQFCVKCKSDNLLHVDNSKLASEPKDKVLIRCMSCWFVMKLKKDLHNNK